jgi:hypothetical protein
MLEPGKQTMATEKQTAANRLNAQKSTGPKTPEGRDAVRLNGVTHGLTAKTLVLKGESEDDFKALFESLEAEHQPTTPTEEILVADLAMATWRRRRLYNMEAGYYKVRMSNEAEYTREKLDDAGLLGKVASNSGDTMALIGRQEARLERSYYKALHELQRLRKEREAKLALVSQSAPAEPVQAPPSRETNDIPSPTQPKIPTPPDQVVNRPSQPAPPAAAPTNL